MGQASAGKAIASVCVSLASLNSMVGFVKNTGLIDCNSFVAILTTTTHTCYSGARQHKTKLNESK